MTLHLSQIFLTDALTFINQFSVLSCQFSATATADFLLRHRTDRDEASLASTFTEASFVAVHDSPAIQIVGRKLDRDFVSRQYPYEVRSEEHTSELQSLR